MKQALGLLVNSWSSEIVVLVGLSFLVMIAAGTATYEASLSPWVFALSFVPLLIFVALKPRLFAPSGREKRIEGDATFTIATKPDETSVGSLVKRVVGLYMAGFVPFSVGFAAWSLLVWLTAHLSSGNIGGFRPDSFSSEVVGGIVVVVYFIGLAIYIAIGLVIDAVGHRNRPVPPSSQI